MPLTLGAHRIGGSLHYTERYVHPVRGVATHPSHALTHVLTTVLTTYTHHIYSPAYSPHALTRTLTHTCAHPHVSTLLPHRIGLRARAPGSRLGIAEHSECLRCGTKGETKRTTAVAHSGVLKSSEKI